MQVRLTIPENPPVGVVVSVTVPVPRQAIVTLPLFDPAENPDRMIISRRHPASQWSDSLRTPL